MLKGWFREARTRKELTLIRRALERIAKCMEQATITGSPTGLMSHYKGSGPDEGADLSYTDDDDLAELEQIDHAAARTGVEVIPGFDGISEEGE